MDTTKMVLSNIPPNVTEYPFCYNNIVVETKDMYGGNEND